MSGTTGTAASVPALTGQLSQLMAQAQSMGLNLGAATGGGTAPAAAGTPAATTPAPGTAGNPSGSGNAMRIPPTGRPEVREIDNQTKYFDKTGNEITAFQYTEAHEFKVKLDYREGIATGLANLSRIFGMRQERVKLMSNALANDANKTGAFNPVDLQKMSLETTTTQQLSEMQKKIFDSMRDSIQAWLR